MGITFIFLSAIALALCNLFLRRGLEMGGDRQALIPLQLFLCLVVAIFLCPVGCGVYTWSWAAFFLGSFSGICIAMMCVCLMRSFELGPPGLTIAIQNAAMLFPPLMLFLILEKEWGMVYTSLNGIGSLLVLGGLFWAARSTLGKGSSPRWLLFAMGTFLFNLGFLFITQWRGIHASPPELSLPLLSADDARNPWYMPTVYFVSTLLYTIGFFAKQKRNFTRTELRYGSLSGAFTGIGIFFLIKATELGTRFEQPILYPLFAVLIIILCNIWGKVLYKERVNWWANGLACLGILLGALDWQALFHS